MPSALLIWMQEMRIKVGIVAALSLFLGAEASGSPSSRCVLPSGSYAGAAGGVAFNNTTGLLPSEASFPAYVDAAVVVTRFPTVSASGSLNMIRKEGGHPGSPNTVFNSTGALISPISGFSTATCSGYVNIRYENATIAPINCSNTLGSQPTCSLGASATISFSETYFFTVSLAGSRVTLTNTSLNFSVTPSLTLYKQ